MYDICVIDLPYGRFFDGRWRMERARPNIREKCKVRALARSPQHLWRRRHVPRGEKMTAAVRPKRLVFYLHKMDETKLLDLSAVRDIDVLPMDLGDGFFHLLGRPEDVQAILSAVKAQTGIVRVYPNLDVAQASNRWA
jgi:hypothetical protein